MNATITSKPRLQLAEPPRARFIKRHAVLTYFILAFAISWGGIALLAGPAGLTGGQLMAGMLLAIAAGPTAVECGRATSHRLR